MPTSTKFSHLPKRSNAKLFARWLLLALITFCPPLQLWAAERTVMVLGDSLSAGYGIETEQGWVSLLQKRLREEAYDYQVVNSSISGETTAGGLARLAKALERSSPSIVIVALGGNDGLRGTPLPFIEKNLQAIVTKNQQFGAKTLLLAMQIPPNYGRRYTEKFHQIYAQIAERNSLRLVPFFLRSFAEDPAMMQADGIHPKAQAQAAMLDEVWPRLKPMLKP